MAEQRPLVLIGGDIQQLSAGDTLVGGGDTVVTEVSSRLIHAQHAQAAGITGAGPSIVGWQDRTLNFIKSNNIPGASLNANQITLPPGDYWVTAKALSYHANRNQVVVYDVINEAILLNGVGDYSTAEVSPAATVSGRITLTTETTIKLRHYITKAQATFGLGVDTTGANTTTVFAEMVIQDLSFDVVAIKGDTGEAGPASILEAPMDGQFYARSDGEWVAVGVLPLGPVAMEVGAIHGQLNVIKGVPLNSLIISHGYLSVLSGVSKNQTQISEAQLNIISGVSKLKTVVHKVQLNVIT